MKQGGALETNRLGRETKPRRAVLVALAAVLSVLMLAALACDEE